MKILVLYFQIGRKNDRVHVTEHLYSFRNYAKGNDYYYFNACNGIPKYLTIPNFDGVIVHYSFLIRRYNKEYFNDWKKKIHNLKMIKGYKIGISQDEYAESDELCNILKEFGIRSVFTCVPESDHNKVFPKKIITLDRIETVLAGYIDEKVAEKLKKKIKNRRTIDVGYRALKHPYWLGRHSQLKYKTGRIFKERLRESELRTDISLNKKDVFHGNQWYRFLLKCRVVLGCEGGASLLDPNGKIRRSVEDYTGKNPDATFDEVEEKCFPGLDNTLNLITVSPRHFESIITKTCQALIEGKYQNILKPNLHYIPIKRDFSNMDNVIEKISDRNYCRRIADRAYKEIYISGKFTYKVFAGKVIGLISEMKKSRQNSSKDKLMFFLLGIWCGIRNFFEPVVIKFIFPWRYLKIYRTDIFRQIWLRRDKNS